jgi:hypothetical protein
MAKWDTTRHQHGFPSKRKVDYLKQVSLLSATSLLIKSTIFQAVMATQRADRTQLSH